MSRSLGLFGYVGATQTGKTSLALRELEELAAVHRLPCLIVDSRRAWNLARFEHAHTLGAALVKVYGRDPAPIAWTPSGQDELDAAARALESVGRCALFVDEIGTWRASSPLEILFRTWAHRSVPVFVTAQNLTGDLGQLFLSCGPRLRLFRSTGPAGLDTLRRYYGLELEELLGLPDGAFIPLDLDRPRTPGAGSQVKADPPPAKPNPRRRS